MPTLSVEAAQERSTRVEENALAARPVGGVGGCVSGGGGEAPAALNATICITQPPDDANCAEAVYVPGEATTQSSAMSPSGLVIMRLIHAGPGPLVRVCTMLAATRRSWALVVVADGVALVALEPVPAAVASTGLPPAPFPVSRRGRTANLPAATLLYSRMRRSTNCAAASNRTVTVFPPAEAAMPLAYQIDCESPAAR